MSNRARFLRPARRLLPALALAVLGVGMKEMPLEAQTAESVRAELDAMRDSARLAQAALKQIRTDVTVEADTFLVELGVRVRYPRAELDDAGQTAIRRAIRATHRRLEQRYGATGVALMRAEVWTLQTVTGGTRRSTSVEVQWGSDPLHGRYRARLPLSVRQLSDAALNHLSSRALALHPAVARVTVGAAVLADAPSQYRMALEHMAASSFAPVQRCAEGAVAACVIMLGPEEQLFLDARTPPVEPGRIFNAVVPGSLVAFALDLGGGAVLDSLARGGKRDDDPVAVLAATVGLTSIELVSQWNARLRATSAERAAPSVPLVLTTVLWCGVLLVVVTRRRPL